MTSLRFLRAMTVIAGGICAAGWASTQVSLPTACPSRDALLAMAADGQTMAQWILAKQLQREAPQFQQEAVEWMRRAAQGGNSSAQYTLGVIYLEGKELPRDPHQAGLWILHAAEQGNQLAQKHMLRLYTEGIGVPKDAFEASHWQFRAARGDEQRRMTLQHAIRPVVEQPQRASLQEYVESATSGSVLAQYALGRMFFDAPFGVRDEQKAVQWMEKAARSGHLQAMLDVGRILALSVDEPDSQSRAMAWLMSVPVASTDRAARVMARVGLQYETGEGVTKDFQRGIFWTTKAAEWGVVKAQLDLARAYAQGLDVPVDVPQAIQWYERAAQQDSAPAQYSLARLFLERPEGLRDDGMAYFWWALSARKGYIGGELNTPGFWDRFSIGDRSSWDRKVREWRPESPDDLRKQRADALDRACP